MKVKRLLISLLALLTFTTAWADVRVNATNFPDANFRNWILAQSYGADGMLTNAELASIGYIDVSGKGIKSLKGIEHFTALTELDCYQNEIKGVAMDVLVAGLPTVVSGTMNVIYNENEQNVMSSIQVTEARAKGWIPMYLDEDFNWCECMSNVAINETNFPDDNFRNWILSQPYGTDEILTDIDVAGVTRINLYNQGIQSLKGIEYFTALKELSCDNNQLMALDVSKNTNLTSLICYNNQLTTLNVLNNSALQTLHCYGNQLTALDVSKNTALQTLYCGDNQLTSLNVSGCINLTMLDCSKNRLKGARMDALVENLPTITKGEMHVIDGDDEENVMTTVQVAAAKIKGWKPMRLKTDEIWWKEYAGSDPSPKGIAINEDNFPDANFRNYLLSKYDGKDSILTYAEIADFKSISLDASEIKSLQGIEFFTALEKLYCRNNQLTALDVSKNSTLKKVYCSNNQLMMLDLSKNTTLEELYCDNNRLYNLNVSGCTALTRLYCYNNRIRGKAMDALVESLPNVNGSLLWVICNENEHNVMTTAHVEAAEDKGWTSCWNVVEHSDKWGYYTSYDNYFGSDSVDWIEIDAFYFPDENFRNWLRSQSYGADELLKDDEIANVTSIDVHFENIQSLQGIELFTELKELDCSWNRLTVLDVSINTALQTLKCYNNQLTAFNVSNNTALQTLDCWSNQLTALNVSGCSNLTYIDCYENQIKGAGMDALVESLPTVNNGKMYVIYNENEQNEMTIDQVEAAKSKGWTPYYKANSWWWEEYAGSEPLPEGILVDKSNFPDEKFRGWILCQEYGKDGVLTEEEIAGITSINVGPGFMIEEYRGNIQSIKGIEYFTALQELDCHSNKLTDLDVSKNDALTMLNCSYNQLASLDVSKNMSLTNLDCNYNQQLTSLNLSGCDALVDLSCSGNYLTELDVSKNSALKTLRCSNNQLTSLDVSKNHALEYLNCYWNRQLISLNLSGCTALVELECSFDSLTVLNVSECPALIRLGCYTNRLMELNLSQNTTLEELLCSGNLLTALDVSQNTALEELNCNSNQLTTLDVSGCTALTKLNCDKNQLTVLDVSGCITLEELYCSGNQLTALDVSDCIALEELYCKSNQLTALDVSGCFALSAITCYQNRIKDEAMDALVENLPTLAVTRGGPGKGEMLIIYNENEQNVMTIDQVDAAKAKGWKPQYYDKDEWGWLSWLDYEGAPDGIKDIDHSPLTTDHYYNLAGQRLQKMQKGINIIGSKKILVK